MLWLKLLTSKSMAWNVVGQVFLGGTIAIATTLLPAVTSVTLAQNQSDVTGPNLSDVTGPNVSDSSGPNLSDNTGILGDPIIGSLGEEATLTDFFKDFFDEFGEELGVDSDASLAEKLRQAKQACSEQTVTRRFARQPGSDIQVTPACTELSRLIQLAQESLFQSNQTGSQPVDQRIW